MMDVVLQKIVRIHVGRVAGPVTHREFFFYQGRLGLYRHLRAGARGRPVTASGRPGAPADPKNQTRDSGPLS